MPRAKRLCLADRCLLRATTDGRCDQHQLRRSWDRVSARNRTRPGDWPTRRLRVLVRDGWACVRCGGRENLVVDHITPVAQGGSWEEDNLQTLCSTCHDKKTYFQDRL